MRINHSENFGPDFINDITGAGQLTVTNGVLRATGISVGDRALKEFYVPNSGYAKVKISVLARARTGKAFLALDAGIGETTYSGMDNIAITETSSVGWTLLELETVVPQQYKHLRVTLGRTQVYDLPSESYFKDIKIEVDNSIVRAPVILAQGLVGAQNGVLTLRPSYRSFGVRDMQYFPATRELIIYLEKNYPLTGGYGNLPIAQVTGTPDSTLIPLAGSFAGDPARFTVKFVENGQFVDISNRSLYFNFSVML